MSADHDKIFIGQEKTGNMLSVYTCIYVLHLYMFFFQIVYCKLALTFLYLGWGLTGDQGK
jgi:hypothetical protein